MQTLVASHNSRQAVGDYKSGRVLGANALFTTGVDGTAPDFTLTLDVARHYLATAVLSPGRKPARVDTLARVDH